MASKNNKKEPSGMYLKNLGVLFFKHFIYTKIHTMIY
jgi:hypothetical protein